MGSSGSKHKRTSRSNNSSPYNTNTGSKKKTKKRRSGTGGDTASLTASETDSRRNSVSLIPNGKVHTEPDNHPAVPLNGPDPHITTNGTLEKNNNTLKLGAAAVTGPPRHVGPPFHVHDDDDEDAENKYNPAVPPTGNVTAIHNVPTDHTDVDSLQPATMLEVGADYNGGGALPKSTSTQNIFSRLKNNKKANILMLWEATKDESRKKLSQLCDVAFLSSDTLAISRGESGKSGLQLYSVQDGRPTGLMGEAFIKAPRGLCTGPDGAVAVTDWEDRTVKFMDAQGDFLGSWKTNKFKHPGGIAINREGRYVVSDIAQGGEAALGLYSPHGKLFRRFGTRNLAWPWYVAVDRRNRILVSERKNACINVFDDAGRFLFAFGANSPSSEQENSSRTSSKDLTFNAPGGLCVDSQNNILVADTDNYRTAMFSPDGVFIKNLVTSTFSRPVSVDYDDGMVAIVTDSDLRLYRTYMEKTSL